MHLQLLCNWYIMNCIAGHRASIFTFVFCSRLFPIISKMSKYPKHPRPCVSLSGDRLTTGGDRHAEGDWKREKRAAVCHSERGLCLWKGGRGTRPYPSSVPPSLERDAVQIILDVADEGNKRADDQLLKKQRFPKQPSLWACSGYCLLHC